MYRSVLALLFATVLLLGGCAAGQQTVPKEKSGQEANMDGAAFDRSDEEITYMDTTENVVSIWRAAASGHGTADAVHPRRYRRQERLYANAAPARRIADYKTVCKGETPAFREAVRVEYDPEQVASTLLLAYFYIESTPRYQNRQGNDRGSQYQTGVYFTNESARETVKRIAEIERGRSEKFFVEIGPFQELLSAEGISSELPGKRTPGYCLPRPERRWSCFPASRIDPGDYRSPRRSPSGT